MKIFHHFTAFIFVIIPLILLSCAAREKTPEFKSVSVNGVELHYTEQGSGETVVLIHGSLVLAEPPILPWLPDIPSGEGIEEGFMAGVWQPMAEAFRESDESGLEFTSQWYFRLPFSEIEPEWQALFQNNVKEWRALAISPETFPMVDYERVKTMQLPVLLLSGGKNAGGFNDLIDGHLERLIPGAERVIIPDSSHEMFLDFPEVTAASMLEFFSKHSP
jgi:pimeloyl-ACP methyl ester carboxylesterase